LYPMLTPWVLFFGAMLYFYVINRSAKFSRETLGALILTGGISSISFVGFPIFQLYYGTTGMSMGIIMSQLGTFLIVMTLGIALATTLSEKKANLRLILKRMVRFPPFGATLICLSINALTDEIPPEITDLATLISQPFAFLALFAVGLQVNFSNILRDSKPLYTGLFYKLIICPLIVFLFFYVNGTLTTTEAKISLLGAALGPMNTAAIIADDFGLDGLLAAKMVSVGIPVSIFSTLLIQYLL
ncbi:MAG: AEC family transporter, partial [Spirosomataceae bacterium]